MNNTEICTIDNLGFLMEVMKLLSGITELDEWDFLKKWSQTEPEDLLKKYDKYISHEFHIFTYFKDKEFFEMVVKPHILNKNQKSFIDYFLLEDKERLLTYLDRIKINKLNILEISLLMIALKDTHRNELRKVQAYYQLRLECVKENTQEYHSHFDTVLKSQQAKENSLLDARNDDKLTIGTTRQTAGRFGIVGRQVANRHQNRSRQQHLFDDDDYDDEDHFTGESRRGSSLQFQTMGVTEEFVDRDFYFADKSFKESKFWIEFFDYILNDSKEPFLSEKFILSVRNPSEILFILSVIDLPFEREDAEIVEDVQGVHLTSKVNSILF